MKKFIFPSIILVAFSACTLSQKKAETHTFEKGITKIETTYANSDEAMEISYNEKNQITKVLGSDNVTLVFSYDKTGLVNKEEFYFEGSLYKFKNINWFTDSVQITKYILDGNNTIEDGLETYAYNENNEISKIIRYKKDSLGIWQKSGSKYEFDWENGNLISYRTYVPTEYSDEDSIDNSEITNNSMTELNEISSLFIHEGYTLFYEATYTYDDKNNPYTNNSISRLILPSNINISKNNPSSIIKKYNSGEELKLDFQYEYNDKDYPTIANVLVTSNMEGLEKTVFKREFNY